MPGFGYLPFRLKSGCVIKKRGNDEHFVGNGLTPITWNKIWGTVKFSWEWYVVCNVNPSVF